MLSSPIRSVAKAASAARVYEAQNYKEMSNTSDSSAESISTDSVFFVATSSEPEAFAMIAARAMTQERPSFCNNCSTIRCSAADRVSPFCSG